MAERDLQTIAADVLRCATSWEPQMYIVDNVTATELARLAGFVLGQCPLRVVTAGANVDCEIYDVLRQTRKIGNES